MASCSEIRLLRPLQLSLIGKAANYSSQLLAPAPLAPVTAAERTKSPQPAAPLYWQTSVGPLAGNRFPLTFGEDSSDGCMALACAIWSRTTAPLHMGSMQNWTGNSKTLLVACCEDYASSSLGSKSSTSSGIALFDMARCPMAARPIGRTSDFYRALRMLAFQQREQIREKAGAATTSRADT
eukprot:s4516_g2.t1